MTGSILSRVRSTPAEAASWPFRLPACMLVQSSRQLLRWYGGNAITDELDYSGSKSFSRNGRRRRGSGYGETNVYATTAIVYGTATGSSWQLTHSNTKRHHRSSALATVDINSRQIQLVKLPQPAE